jgi:hypothetical protein
VRLNGPKHWAKRAQVARLIRAIPRHGKITSKKPSERFATQTPTQVSSTGEEDSKHETLSGAHAEDSPSGVLRLKQRRFANLARILLSGRNPGVGELEAVSKIQRWPYRDQSDLDFAQRLEAPAPLGLMIMRCRALEVYARCDVLSEAKSCFAGRSLTGSSPFDPRRVGNFRW